MPKVQRDSTGSSTSPSPLLLSSSSMDEFREGCLKLEKARHSRVYEAEKRLLYLEHSIMLSYALEISTALDEHVITRHHVTMKALAETMEKIKQLEQARYGFASPSSIHSTKNGGTYGHVYDKNGGKQDDNQHHNSSSTNNNNKYDMSLRGRVSGGAGGAGVVDDRFRIDDDILYDDMLSTTDRGKKTKKGDHRNQKVKVHIELDENDVLADLEELRGEKRTRDQLNNNCNNGNHNHNQPTSSSIQQHKQSNNNTTTATTTNTHTTTNNNNNQHDYPHERKPKKKK